MESSWETRRHVQKIFNKKREDFNTNKAYDDYEEEKEKYIYLLNYEDQFIEFPMQKEVDFDGLKIQLERSSEESSSVNHQVTGGISDAFSRHYLMQSQSSLNDLLKLYQDAVLRVVWVRKGSNADFFYVRLGFTLDSLSYFSTDKKQKIILSKKEIIRTILQHVNLRFT